jgi:hypothetical protein
LRWIRSRSRSTTVRWPVRCQNSCRGSDLGFYARHLCSSACTASNVATRSDLRVR